MSLNDKGREARIGQIKDLMKMSFTSKEEAQRYCDKMSWTGYTYSIDPRDEEEDEDN